MFGNEFLHYRVVEERVKDERRRIERAGLRNERRRQVYRKPLPVRLHALMRYVQQMPVKL